jgi:hypothetical protein
MLMGGGRDERAEAGTAGSGGENERRRDERGGDGLERKLFRETLFGSLKLLI